MGITELLLLSVGLAMDAFAVSIGNGLAMKKRNIRAALAIALSFGVFQAAMPLAGYFLGTAFEDIIRQFDHYIALIFLGFIGGKMIWDGIKELRESKRERIENGAEKAADREVKGNIAEPADGENKGSLAESSDGAEKASLDKKGAAAEKGSGEFHLTLGTLLIQAVATSIDALIVGVSFAALPDVNIWSAVGLIGVITFAISLSGVFFGKKFGQLLGSRAEVFGGIILVCIGLKVFIEHMFFGG